jgi:hypothetical protein
LSIYAWPRHDGQRAHYRLLTAGAVEFAGDLRPRNAMSCERLDEIIRRLDGIERERP